MPLISQGEISFDLLVNVSVSFLPNSKGPPCNHWEKKKKKRLLIIGWFLFQVCEYPDGTKSLKLGDFGLATVVEGPLYTVCGTPTYVAPEIIAETGYASWGLGLVL